jgi:hypothetical protein
MVSAAVMAISNSGRTILSSFLYTRPSYQLIRIVRYDTNASQGCQYLRDDKTDSRKSEREAADLTSNPPRGVCPMDRRPIQAEAYLYS